jgi:hypothetical protein
MEGLDIRDTFCTPLIDLIQKNTDKGYAYLRFQEVNDLIREATQHRDKFRPHFTDAEVARIVTDLRIDWRRFFVTSDDVSYPESGLSFVLLHMEMKEYVSWLPLTTSAINERYSPATQVEILKKSFSMPAHNNGVIDNRQLLAGRIAPMILQSEAHVDAWVDAWMKGLKRQERFGHNTFTPFSEALTVTKAYRKLKEGDTDLDGLPVLMPFAGLLETEMFTKSVSRYVDASLYELSDGAFSGQFFNRRDDYLRRSLVYGLYLLKGDELESLVTLQIGHKALTDNHLDISAALLASSINWHRELIDLKGLCEVRHVYETRDAVDVLLKDHAFSWDKDWFAKLKETEHCKPLQEQVGKFESFRAWVMDYASKSQFASMAAIKQLPVWISMMTDEDREKTYQFLIDKFRVGITVKDSKYSTGILYGKVLLSAFPDDEYAQACISDQVGYLVKRALKDDHTELLAAVIEKGFVTPAMVGQCIWNLKEFNTLTKSGSLTTKLLLPFVKPKVKGAVMCDQMGL